MNRANQQQLVQSTNQAVIGIRQAEINYYYNLNQVFGSQAALIGGFTYGNLAQNTINGGNQYSDTYCTCYYTLAACTIGLSIHVIICTMLIQVFGPGLAINGPLGSMTRATEGMRCEVNQIIFTWILMMLAFCSNTVFLFWAIMRVWEATASSILFLVAARYWYYYTERIYLRFYWDQEDSNWNQDEKINEGLEEPTLHNKTINNIINSNNNKNNDNINNENQLKSKYMNRNIFNYLFKSKTIFNNKNNTDIKHDPNNNNNSINNINSTSNMINNTDINETNATNEMHIILEGYVTIGRNLDVTVVNTTIKWERRYLILLKLGYIYIYKTRQDFRLKPTNPLYSRPLRLNEFNIKVINNSTNNISTTTTTTTSNNNNSNNNTNVIIQDKNSSNSNNHNFQIILIPYENEEYDNGSHFRSNWLLKYDIEEELILWIDCIKEIYPDNFIMNKE